MTPEEAVKIKAIVNYRDDRILEELAEEFPEYADVFLPEPKTPLRNESVTPALSVEAMRIGTNPVPTL